MAAPHRAQDGALPLLLLCSFDISFDIMCSSDEASAEVAKVVARTRVGTHALLNLCTESYRKILHRLQLCLARNRLISLSGL
jgi:hypothetical protein